MTPEQRTLRARLAAHARWAREPDRVAALAPARRALADRFEREVDPEGVLTPEERARRAEHARLAYMYALARRSAKVRRRRIEEAARAGGSRSKGPDSDTASGGLTPTGSITRLAAAVPGCSMWQGQSDDRLDGSIGRAARRGERLPCARTVRSWKRADATASISCRHSCLRLGPCPGWHVVRLDWPANRGKFPQRSRGRVWRVNGEVSLEPPVTACSPPLLTARSIAGMQRSRWRASPPRRYDSRSISVRPLLAAEPQNTPSWQFSIRPAVPEY
jgi:hypothetical protein